MKKFMVIGHASQEAMANVTPKQFEKGMDIWNEWTSLLGEKLIDMGCPMFGGIKLTGKGNSEPSTKNVAGYGIIEAKSMEEALTLCKSHPQFSYGDDFYIEIHECRSME